MGSDESVSVVIPAGSRFKCAACGVGWIPQIDYVDPPFTANLVLHDHLQKQSMGRAFPCRYCQARGFVSVILNKAKKN